MEANYKDKSKAIEYLSIIRDAEIDKPAEEMSVDLIDACVGLLLHLQDKNEQLTPEQIHKAVEAIPFVETEKIKEFKNENKKINKLKLLLIAAIIPIILTVLTLLAMADIDWSDLKAFEKMFGGVYKAPVGEVYHHGDTDFSKIDGSYYENTEDFYKATGISVLAPGEGFKDAEVTSILYTKVPICDEILFAFNKENLGYTVYMGDKLEADLENTAYTQKSIKGLECYIVDLSDVGLYQVYFNHKGYTYCIVHSDLDVIVRLIENMEEAK